jgi:hypothetical protein
MKLEKILKEYQERESCYSVEKVSILTVDNDPLAEAELRTDNPDLPIIIKQGDSTIKIPNRDIPQFVAAIAAMCDENYF